MARVNRSFRNKILSLYRNRKDLIPRKGVYVRRLKNKIECCAIGCMALSIDENVSSSIADDVVIDKLKEDQPFMPLESLSHFIIGVATGFDSKVKTIKNALKKREGKLTIDYLDGIATGYSIQKAIFGGKK